jgi:hypothetical protein
MELYLVAGLLLVPLVTPALAVSQCYAVVNTVGNCPVINTKPSPYDISGLKILGERLAIQARPPRRTS